MSRLSKPKLPCQGSQPAAEADDAVAAAATLAGQCRHHVHIVISLMSL